MQTVDFTDIRLRAALPLHPYLDKHPHLFLRLVADGVPCGDTAGVDGNLVTGIWEYNTKLYAHGVRKSLIIAVLTGLRGPGIQVVSAKVRLAALLEQVNACPNEYQDFTMFDSRAPMQLKLVMTCSIKLPSVLDTSPKPIFDDGGAANRRIINHLSSLKPEKINYSSRKDLEALYVMNTQMPEGDESKAGTLGTLGYAYQKLYHKQHTMADLEKAISIYEEATRFTGLPHPQLAELIHRFSIALFDRFKQSGDRIDLERSISYCHAALRFTEEVDMAKPSRFCSLGNALELRFQSFGDLVDREKSIWCLREAVRLTPDAHADKPRWLCNLGTALQSRFEDAGSLADLEEAILNKRKAVDLTPDSDPDKPRWHANLGYGLQCRFERLDSIADLDDAIVNFQKAIHLTPDGHPDKPSRFGSLGAALKSRYERLYSLADIESAVSSFQKATQLTPDGHPSKPGQLSNLGAALDSRFERLGNLADIDAAISNHRQAVQLTPGGHPGKPGFLSNLGVALKSRFKCLRRPEDIEDAISNLQEAARLMPDGHPVLFSSLGDALHYRFESTGNLADLEDAICNFRLVVEQAPDGHPDSPSWFMGLGLVLRIRFDHLGGLKDLEDAISILQQAVQFTSDGHPDKPGLLTNLGAALDTRYERLGSPIDSDEAISNHRQAVQLRTDDHPNKPTLLSNLGVALKARFERHGNIADLEDAISNLQQAVKLTPEGHPDDPRLSSNLGSVLFSRFERSGSLTDLEEAILTLQQAVRSTPDDGPLHALLLHNLGRLFFARFKRLGIPSDLDNALSTYATAANSKAGSAMVRFKAARSWAEFSEANGKPPLEAFSCAIDLLPRIAWLGLAVTDQHALLADVGYVVREAVAVAIKHGEYQTAVVWAEQGRSIVWQNLLGLRSPIDDLREAQPELADRLHSIARRIEGSGSSVVGSVDKSAPAVDAPRNNSQLAIQWDILIDEIRRIPQFESFLRAKSFSQLSPAAHEGPIVIINVNNSQCDAIVLIADKSPGRHVSVVNIPLERFSHEKSKILYQTLTSLLSSAGVRERSERKSGRAQAAVDSNAKFKNILRILWQDVVKPVIDGLAFQAETKRPPRIWWCATGLLAFLPIHAAGLYDTPEVGQKLSDYAVSSYTPTLNAILEVNDPTERGDFQVLTVAQASAPGAQLIPKTEDEVKIVQMLTASARTLNLTGENATVERVLQGMMESTWIHLACHGQQDPGDPMESGFLLHDRILKLSEIVKTSLPKADFAFLSACQTAMGDDKIAEESAHLAAGMLLSGCRGVIATTWSIRDEDAPKIAEDVYSRIFKDGKPNRKEAAYALHEAIKRLRESGVDFMSWVPFIHIGR